MRVSRRIALVIHFFLGWVLALAWGIANAEATLVLKRDFVEKYKNRGSATSFL